MKMAKRRCISGRTQSQNIHIIVLTGLLTLLACASSWAEEFAIKLEKSVQIPMRDGVNLSTDLYFPEGAKGPLPAVLIRTVYNKKGTLDWNSVYKKLVQKGYVLAIQDIRGRYESEGEYIVAKNRREDGYDTLDWLISQPWSNQKIGTAGCSYLGETQVVLAAAKHPNHLAAIPMSAASGYYAPGRAWQSFSGGAFELGQTAGWFASNGSQVFYGPPASVDRESWFRSAAAEAFQMAPTVDFPAYLELLPTLPVSTLLERANVPPSEYKSWVTSHPDGDFFRNKDLAKADDTYDVPAIFFDNWYDYGPSITIEMFQQFQNNAQTESAKNNQFMIIGPGTHCDFRESTEEAIIGERNLGDVSLNYSDIQLNWYDYWLKGDQSALNKMPKVQYYLMGKNEWRSSDVWPLENTKMQAWYISSEGNANSLSGDGGLSMEQQTSQENIDHFTYDPKNPVPSLGGHTCCTGSDKEAGGYDQSEIESRQDVLVYSSPVLTQGLEVTGKIKSVLYVSSSAVDTDFTVKLVDVYPDGRAFNIQEGVVRMRYRESLSHATLMTPGEVYKIEVDLNATSNYFPAGHKIRIEISSSNFPRWDRNMNTGGNNFDAVQGVIAENKVYHSRQYPSHILLPVIEGNRNNKKTPAEADVQVLNKLKTMGD